jgi:imidazolonepropionase-like amidohydrolase
VRLTLVAVVLVWALAGCRPASHTVPQAIVGAMLIDGTVRPPIQAAVVLVSRGRVEAVGEEGKVRIPKGYNRIEVRGRFLFPVSLDERIEAGEEANLLVLSVNPALDHDYLKKVTGRMESGRWVQYPQ